jgi:YVTN family beta-propeller protein
VIMSDDRCATVEYVEGDSGADDILGIGESWIYFCTAVISETTTNVAVVTALDSSSQPISATATAQVIVPYLYLPLILTPVVDVPCPPPDGCPIDNLDETKALAVHRGKDRIYIVSRNGDRLLAVDAKSNEVLAIGETGAQPWGLVVNENSGRVYVGNYGSDDVWVYDDDTLALLAKIPVGTNPALMAALPAMDTVFVLIRSTSRVAIIQGLTVVQDISSGGSGPFGIAADPLTGNVYIGHRDSRSLSLLRYQNGAWSAQVGPQFVDSRQLFGLAFNALNRKLYSLYADAAGNWKLDIWEPKEESLWGLRATRSIPSGGDPNSAAVGGVGIAVNQTTGNLFIANTGANSLTVVDGDSDAAIATVALGNEPFAIAVDDSRNKVYTGLRLLGKLIKLDDNY